MLDDQQLLRRYVADGSEAAFGELVGRYVNLVYSAALRRTGGDAHLAQDVAQLVFTDLARKARSLPKDVVLAGWLHTATRFAAAQMVRTERRRQAREQEAAAMNDLKFEPTPDWDQIRLTLDEDLDQLGHADRDALVLRFFEQRSLAEVGHALGTNEDTARKRVSRALDKLRILLVRRGVTTTATAISTAVSANAVQAAPAGLAATLTSASLAGAATGTGTTLTLLKLMTMTKLQAGIIGALVVAGAATTLMMQHQSQANLRNENQSLRQQIAQLQADNESLSHRVAQENSKQAPHLPAPRMQAFSHPTEPPSDNVQSTNLYGRLRDKEPKLTAEQVKAYLAANRRNAASLLAAYRVTRDPALLEEAKQKYPDDPQVAFEAAFDTSGSSSPEQRRQWLDAFKKSASDNALPNYLSALDYFKAGQADQAVQELIAASGKQPFQDYTLARVQDDEEAYLAAGYSVAEAKAVASMQLLLPQLGDLKQLTHSMVDLANSYRQAGDEASAQAVLQMAANLGQRYSTASAGEPEISQLVGMAVERIALSALDPNSPYGSDGQTVQERLDQLAQRRAALTALNQQLEPLLPLLSDQDCISYKDRWLLFGEENAMQWVISKYGQK